MYDSKVGKPRYLANILVNADYILNISLAHASCFEITPIFPFPGRILAFGTLKALLSVLVRNLTSPSTVPSVNVIELGDELGLLLCLRFSRRTGTSAFPGVGVVIGSKSNPYGWEG